MIRSGQALLLLAEFSVDGHRFQSLGDRLRSEQEVDAQALPAVEGAAAVVPPGEGLLVGETLSEQIPQAEGLEARDAFPLGVGVKDVTGELLLVPAVERGGGRC